jgi:hypothetical protein
MRALPTGLGLFTNAVAINSSPAGTNKDHFDLSSAVRVYGLGNPGAVAEENMLREPDLPIAPIMDVDLA